MKGLESLVEWSELTWGFNVISASQALFAAAAKFVLFKVRWILQIKQQNVYLDFHVNWLNLTCCLDFASCGLGESIDNDAKVGKLKDLPRIQIKTSY